MDRAEIVHQNFINRIQNANLPEIYGNETIPDNFSKSKAIEVFESQILSRLLDLQSRRLQKQGEGYYTIGSSGHEGNAAIAESLRVTDMAFLHYRSGGFFVQRTKQKSGTTPTWDMLLSFCASSDDPIAQGRHKVFGSKELFVPPQTSTIASHLPKAVGGAYSIGLNKKLGQIGELQSNSVVMCSFGDASLNHSTAQGAINTASWTSYQNIPMPILFVCEDNNIGISTSTPEGWVESRYKNHAGIKYFSCDGLNIFDTYKVAYEAQRYVRLYRKPAFLHFKCVRLYGHAGADMQTAYMSKEKMEADEANDPLLHSSKLLINNNLLSANQIFDLYNTTENRLEKVASKAITRPKLNNADDVMKSITPPKNDNPCPIEKVSKKDREEHFGRELKMQDEPTHMAKAINWALHDIMLEQRNVVLAGEDIGPKGGVYNVTASLHKKFGAHRVINTLLDEQSILGLAIGMAHNNILPIPEIQFLAYLHNAEDQLRGEAATLSFFSNGQYTNPMVVRIAGLAYQKGFGGHFHNDNSFNVLRDIPGIIVACPSNAQDAPSMLRECVRLAEEENRVVVFLEPIALYMTKDLHKEKDGQWSFKYSENKNISYGKVATHGKGKDICIVTYGNGYYLSRQAEKVLKEKYKIKTTIIDLRWLCPLPKDEILKITKSFDDVLIVDECRKTGSISEEIVTLLKDKKNVDRLCAEDSFIPLGRAYASTLPSKNSIIEKVLEMVS